MNLESRLQQINDLLPALMAPALVALIAEETKALTQRLIAENNEETRGRIKALRDLQNMSEALKAERDSITAGLSNGSDPALSPDYLLSEARKE